MIRSYFLIILSYNQIDVIFTELVDSDLHSAYKVSMWLMSKELWTRLLVYEFVLVFQLDSLLLHQDIHRFLDLGLPFIGAYSPGTS